MATLKHNLNFIQTKYTSMQLHNITFVYKSPNTKTITIKSQIWSYTVVNMVALDATLGKKVKKMARVFGGIVYGTGSSSVPSSLSYTGAPFFIWITDFFLCLLSFSSFSIFLKISNLFSLKGRLDECS